MVQRRTLVVVLVLLGAVAVASGLTGVIVGPTAIPGGMRVSASVDSEYRFVNVFWLAAGAALWWSLRRPRERRTITRLTLALAIVGGLARVVSIVAEGWPHPVFVAALLLELVVVPAVLWWHVRAFGRGGGQTGSG